MSSELTAVKFARGGTSGISTRSAGGGSFLFPLELLFGLFDCLPLLFGDVRIFEGSLPIACATIEATTVRVTLLSSAGMMYQGPRRCSSRSGSPRTPLNIFWSENAARGRRRVTASSACRACRSGRETAAVVLPSRRAEELENQRAVADEVSFKPVDIVVPLLPQLFRGFSLWKMFGGQHVAMDLRDEDLLVIRTVEDADASAVGEGFRAPPQERMVQLFDRGTLERMDLATLRIGYCRT